MISDNDWELKQEIVSWIDRAQASMRDRLERKIEDERYHLERDLLRNKIFNRIKELNHDKQ